MLFPAHNVNAFPLHDTKRCICMIKKNLTVQNNMFLHDNVVYMLEKPVTLKKHSAASGKKQYVFIKTKTRAC